MNKSFFSHFFSEEAEKFCNFLLLLQKKIPTFFPIYLFKLSGTFIAKCPIYLFENRSHFILSRILFSHFRLMTQLKKRYNLFFDLKTLTLNSTEIGISFCLDLNQENLRYQEIDIIPIIEKLTPGFKTIGSSFFTYQYHHFRFFYWEIRKMRAGFSLLKDKKKFKEELFYHLRNCKENTFRPLCVPGNEEEIFKNISHLKQELKLLKDIPQVIVSFVAYTQKTLKFMVIVLRFIHPDSQGIPDLSSKLPSTIHFSLEYLQPVGLLRKKYPKEAAVFTLEVNSSLFLGHNSSVNLRAGRQYIVKSLESMLGPFRDYNGGLLIKESEQLIGIRRILDEKEISFPFVDDLFYSLKPSALRAVADIDLIYELILCFQEALQSSLSKDEKYRLFSHFSQRLQISILKTSEKDLKIFFPASILKHSFEIGSACVEDGIFIYICFFLNNGAIELSKLVEQELVKCQNFKQKATLRLNFQGGDPLSLNPHFASDIYCHILADMLFEGLTRINPEGCVEPAIAKKIHLSSCGKFYTFHLRTAQWSNGEEISAYHFERSWKEALANSNDKEIGGPPDYFSPIKNVTKFRDKECSLSQVGITAKNSRLLQVELEVPCSYFLHLTATPYFFPLFAKAWEPSDFNGPFILAEWKQGVHLTLTKNPFYWEANKNRLEEIAISMVKDPHLAYEMFKKKELDFLGDPISPLPPELLKKSSIQKNIFNKPVSRIFWLHCNTQTFPLNNVHLRLALHLAINRKKLIKKIFIKQIPQFSLLPPKYSDLKENPANTCDLAKKYFEKALKELGLHENTFPHINIIHSELSFEKPLIDELKKQWKETLGITIISQEMSWGEFSASLQRGDFQMGGLFRRDLFNSPLFYLNFFNPSSDNPYALKNEEYEILLKQFSKNEDPQTLKKLETLLMENIPAIPLISQCYMALLNPKVKGINWNENGCLNLKEAWIDYP